MDSALAANVASLDRWLQHRSEDAQRHASDKEFNRTARELIKRFGSEAELDEPAIQAKLDEPDFATWEKTISSDRYVGWVLLDANSRIIAASHASLPGKSLPLPADVSPRLIQLQATVTRPFKSKIALAPVGPLSVSEAPTMVAVAPVSEGARLIGAFGLLIDPQDEFAKILQIARLGETGEIYAFDREGLMLSPSRFERELRQSGLLPEDSSVESPLNVYIRDPGFDIRDRTADPVAVRAAKLTWMADHATRGATGSTIDGYRNYRGVMVIGSWSWLHDYEMGVAAEVDCAEAYAPIRIMSRAFYALIGVISLIGLGLLGLLALSRWLDRRGVDGSRRLGQYDLGSVIGQGGMGAVYRGRHELLQRDVAIKVLERSEVTSRTLARFEREVRMTAQLRHPNTIDIYDYGHTDDGTFFYVMEYLNGITLQRLVDDYGRQPAERVIFLLLQMCGSLSEAHKQALVHRDVKPANVLLAAQAGLYDMVKVLDFGLVKEVRRENTQLTQNSSITGTPLYMSPESVRDASQANQQSDIYSVGAVGYFLLTGLPTFDGDSAADICVKQLHQQPIRCDKRIGYPLPDDLQNIIMSCLRKEASERPATMEELAGALIHCQNANAWTPVDACQWWEQVYDGPRDERVDFADNESSRPDREASGELSGNPPADPASNISSKQSPSTSGNTTQ